MPGCFLILKHCNRFLCSGKCRNARAPDSTSQPVKSMLVFIHNTISLSAHKPARTDVESCTYAVCCSDCDLCEYFARKEKCCALNEGAFHSWRTGHDTRLWQCLPRLVGETNWRSRCDWFEVRQLVVGQSDFHSSLSAVPTTPYRTALSEAMSNHTTTISVVAGSMSINTVKRIAGGQRHKTIT